MAVERDVVRREARRLAVLRVERPVVPERLDVLRLEVPGERVAPALEAAQDLGRRHAEREDEAVALREAGPPVVGVPLELEPAPRLEVDDAEGPGADAPLPVARREVLGPLRDDRRRV